MNDAGLAYSISFRCAPCFHHCTGNQDMLSPAQTEEPTVTYTDTAELAVQSPVTVDGAGLAKVLQLLKMLIPVARFIGLQRHLLAQAMPV